MPQQMEVVEGLTTRSSRFDQSETRRRLLDAVVGHGMGLVAEIDHAAAASRAGLRLRPTNVLIFGNALAGTPLMELAPTMAIDLPLKVLLWTDESGAVSLAYVDPVWLATRHAVAHTASPVLDKMREALATVTTIAVGG